MLFDLMQVRKAAGKELEFLNKIQAITVFDNGVTRSVLLLGNDDRRTGLLQQGPRLLVPG